MFFKLVFLFDTVVIAISFRGLIRVCVVDHGIYADLFLILSRMMQTI